MQAWKITKKTQNRSNQKTKTKALGVLLILATFGALVFDFPQLWNSAVAQTNISLPTIQEESFRLGLDLQGGTHLVYEADMSEIPEADQVAALEGVRDVVERRADAFGVAEPVVQTVTTGGVHRVIVELAGVLDVNEAIALIGETPVLEFKEPGTTIERPLTQEEQTTLDELHVQERALANQILAQAKQGTNFDDLVLENSLEPNADKTLGHNDGLTTKVPAYEPIVNAIIANGSRPGMILPQVIETEEGLNIVKFTERRDPYEMLLSHILICFEDKLACQNPIPALDASLKINQLKEQATPENFADLATEHSNDQGGFGAGDLGWIIPGETVPAFELAAQRTAVGEISDVVETEFGYHIIHKREERTITVYDIQRVLIPLSSELAVVPDASPWTNTELSGKHLDSAAVEFDPNSGLPYVGLNFNTEGGELFGDLTASHVGQPIAIFLDGAAISTPVVESAIYGGRAIITGNFTLDEAKLLAQRLNAGALPVPVNLLSQQTVGPTLGSISLNRSIEAALIGFALIALFMILVYRLPGLLAVCALILYALLNLAIYRIFGITITLAGIAGFVLSLGIAVDANVLIIERIKEEFLSGRDLSSSVTEGFRRAWTAIRDGNITTIIAAVVLFWFSSSFIRGFALTLAIGVILSMFTAIVVTRIYFKNVFSLKAMKKDWLYGFGKREE